MVKFETKQREFSESLKVYMVSILGLLLCTQLNIQEKIFLKKDQSHFSNSTEQCKIVSNF